jgi:lantibiotic modifying enzyme
VGLTPLEETEYAAGLLPPDLYDGVPGVGIFFAYLNRVLPDPRYRRIAERARSLNILLIEERAGAKSCGAFSGLASLIYAELHLAKCLDGHLASAVSRALPRLLRLVRGDDHFDIVSGAAGALLVSLRLWRSHKVSLTLEVAKAAALRLESTAEPMTRGIAWHTLKTHDNRLGGMAHGVSGIAWALTEWYEHTGHSKWKALAAQASEFEDSLFDERQRAWIVARRGALTCYWCYGAPGIGLAVDRMRSVLGDYTCNGVIARAQQATWANGLLRNHSLCHGNLGNLEVFRLTDDHEKIDTMLV